MRIGLEIMVDRNTFTETLRAVKEIAGTSPGPMDRETALSYFKDMELTPQQEELVYQFLLQEEQEQEAGDFGEEPEAGDLAEEDQEPEASDAKKGALGSEKNASGPKAAGQGTEARRETDSAHFQMYLEEIQGIRGLRQEAEEELYERLLLGDVSVMEAITGQWLSRIVAIAEEYEDRGYPVEDLVQEGNMGLLLSLHVLSRNSREGGNPKLTAAGVPTLLKGAIRESMEQYLGEESGQNQQIEAVLAKVSLVHQAREFLTREKGETPSLRELAAYTRLSAEEISDILSLVKDAG